MSGHLNALSDAIGDKLPVRAITPDLLARAVAQWRTSLAPATINRRLSVAQGLWGVAQELWGIHSHGGDAMAPPAAPGARP